MLFSAFAIAAVGRTAQEVVVEVREQFLNKPGILLNTVWAPLGLPPVPHLVVRVPHGSPAAWLPQGQTATPAKSHLRPWVGSRF